MKNGRLHAFSTIFALLKVYILILAVCFAFRLALLLLMNSSVTDCTFGDFIKMFWYGMRYDTVIATYLLIIPFLLLSAECFTGKKLPVLEKSAVGATTVSAVPLAFVLSADIPYFRQFFTHFNITAFDGMEGNFGIVTEMIFEELEFWLMIFPLMAVVALFHLLSRKFFIKDFVSEKGNITAKILCCAAMVAVMFFGMRGNADFKRRPLQAGDFYFSDNQTVNQLTLNPAFVFMKSLSRHDQIEINFMDGDKAMQIVRNQMGIANCGPRFPLARHIVPTSEARPMNVVLIIMESMTAGNLQYFGNQNDITPFLDSLIGRSIFFENCYSTGNRTCCGIYASITGYPTLYDHQPLYSTPIRQFNSLPHELKQNGYSTAFFLSHDKNFDNCNGFLLANGYDRVYSLEDYPAGAQKNMWGVSDDFLLDFASHKIDSLGKLGRPFFATILTISNHPPFCIPEKYRKSGQTDRQGAVRFSDAMLHRFFDECSTKPWFENTLFVLVGDHGTSEDATYPLPLSYFHVPLIFYSSGIEAQVSGKMASQNDILPTVMNFLQLPYCHNSFGNSLLSSDKPYACMMNTSGYAVIDREWLLVYLLSSNSKHLYRYTSGDKTDYLPQFPDIAEKMDTYATARWQTANLLLQKQQTFCSR